MSVLALLEEAAGEAPSRGFAFLRSGQVVDRASFAQLAQRAREVGVALRQEGARPGQRALLVFGPGLEFVRAFWGCLYAGLVPVPAPAPHPFRPERTLARLLAIARDCRAQLLLTDSRRQAFEQSPLRVLELGRLRGDASLWRDPGRPRGDLALLQYTSGSTQQPRGVKITHANLTHNLGMLAEFLRPAQDVVMVHWLPLFHDMGLVRGMLSPVHLKGCCSMMDPMEFIQAPWRWLQALSDFQATVTGAPSFGYAVAAHKVRLAHMAGWDLSSLRVAFCSAEPIQARALARFVEKLQPCGLRPEVVKPSYGLAEATVMVTGETGPGMVCHKVSRQALGRGQVEPPTGVEDGWELVSCGRALGQQQVLIVDRRRRPCPPRVVGEIWVAGPSVGRGYWGRSGLSRRVFAARLADGRGPFLRTGDLGWLEERGELTVCGRLKDLLIVRGQNIYPQDLEAILEEEVAALRPGCCAAFPGEDDEVVVAAETVSPSEELAAAVSRAAGGLGVSLRQVVLLAPGELPKTASGKLQRSQAQARYLEGQWRDRPGWRRPRA